VSYTRRFSAAALSAVAVFVICYGAGMANWPLALLGIAGVILSASLVIVSAVRGNARSFVRGTAHVLDVTEPPPNLSVGRCELQIVVEAPDLAPAKVKIRDTRVPVAKWPDIGDTLPIRVAIEDPRHVRILWDEVPTHGEEAAEEERFNEYVQRIVEAEFAGDDDRTLDEGVIPPYPEPDETAPPTVPRPRPSPRPRRHAAAAGGATATVASPPSGGTPTAPPSGPAASPAAGSSVREMEPEPLDDEVPVHDIVPIEGASAVLGVPPGAAARNITPEEADAEAVKDLLAAYPTAGPVNGISGLGVTLIVTDLTRTIAFYRDKLGFQVLDGGASSAVLASGDTRLMVRCVPDMPRVDRRVVHLNLEVSDVEAAYADLVERGVRFIHRPRPVARGEHMELWAAAFRDPDGHGIALIKWQPI
jgi:catechol 2,3-dioxygenase-like lactoylglutathione lyase family enzyme